MDGGGTGYRVGAPKQASRTAIFSRRGTVKRKHARLLFGTASGAACGPTRDVSNRVFQVSSTSGLDRARRAGERLGNRHRQSPARVRSLRGRRCMGAISVRDDEDGGP